MNPQKIRTGDLLFLVGKSALAEQIQDAQYDRGFLGWKYNHVGWFIWINGELCVAEEDFPGVFDINLFKNHYADTAAEVYVGQIKNQKLTDAQIELLTRETILEASKGKLTNYAFLDILSFKFNSLMYKWFKWDVWIGRTKNKHDRFTCSQRTCKYLQDYFGILDGKNYIEAYPADVADDQNIIIEKINY